MFPRETRSKMPESPSWIASDKILTVSEIWDEPPTEWRLLRPEMTLMMFFYPASRANDLL